MDEPDAFDDPDAAALAAEVLDTCVFHAVRRCAGMLGRLYARHFAAADLTPSQFLLLSLIAEGRAASAADLARQAGLERSTLTRSLRTLTAAGWIADDAAAGLRRRPLLTEAGAAKLHEGLGCWRAAQADLLQWLPRDTDAAARLQLRSLRTAARAAGGADL